MTLTTAQAAKIIGLSTVRVRALAAAGKLKGKKLGSQWTFKKTDIEAYTPREMGRPKKLL